jgi:UDP-N-acetyl-D-mannosaminuronic acid dehydrogenase
MKNIAIFGIGRVGLPLALCFADKGCSVLGVDIDEKKLATLKTGKMPFVEENADPILKKHINKNFQVTTDVKRALDESDAIILTLGTPVDEHMNPIFSQIENVFKNMLPHLRKGHVICLRSTVAPGTTEYLQRYIERNTKFKVGKDVYLAFCPERIAEGKAIEETGSLPSIIGGLDEESKKKADEVFSILTNKSLLTDARSAELAKLYCNMYRYINFAVANEFMMIAETHERDIYEIINLVNAGYKRGGLKQPGFSAGPCLYKDGFFLVNKTPFTDLISTSWKVNETVPAYLIELIRKKRDLKSSKVAILGLAFKKNIDDTRNSLSYKAKKVFLAEGAQVVTHDPFIENGNLAEVVKGCDVVFVATNHDYYVENGIDVVKKNAKKGCIVCDIWNIYETGKIIFEA